MASWSYDTCIICYGKGKVKKTKTCPLCHGYGFWEFVLDDNALAIKVLSNVEIPANDHVKELCNRRLNQFTPDNFETEIKFLKKGLKGNEDEAFNALHEQGAAKWGWAWVHANRFAIELCSLCGGNPTAHRYALSNLAWKWLTEEKQEKVDIPS